MEALALLHQEDESTSSGSRSSDESSSYAFDTYNEKGFIPGSHTFSHSLNFSRFIPSFRPRIRLARYSTFSLPPRYARLWLMLCNFLRILLPSFIPISRGYHPPTPARELHPTAWLDGLRGTAALLVVFHHTSHAWFSDRIKAGYGSGEDGLNVYLIQIPIIRLLISGAPQVAIFFVVSGYAISYKPLKLMHGGRPKELLDSLSASVFRRHTRLFLPATVVMFVCGIMRWMDWYGVDPSRAPPHAKSLSDQIYNWAAESMKLAHPFNIPDRYIPSYDQNLWTLPIEFRNSMYLYGTLLALSRLRSNMRLLFTSGIVMFCCYKAHWDIMLFISGMLLADLHIHRSAPPEKQILSPRCNCNCDHGQHASKSSSSLNTLTATLQTYRRYIWTVCFTISLFLLSMPEVGRGAGTSPGYATLTKYIPNYYISIGRPDHFWAPLGAMFLVFSTDNERSLQRIFETRFAQYMGKISFSMYMVHGPLLYTLGEHMLHRTVAYFGQETSTQYGWAAVSAFMVLFPTIIWVGDLVWRFVDTKAVRFGRWISDQII